VQEELYKVLWQKRVIKYHKRFLECSKAKSPVMKALIVEQTRKSYRAKRL
jgi:hypothetical protein